MYLKSKEKLIICKCIISRINIIIIVLELAHETLFMCRHGLNIALLAIKISLDISVHHVLVIPLIFIKHLP